MFQENRFEMIDGDSVADQAEEWADTFFFNLMNIINVFFAQISIEETIIRLKSIDFAALALDQLENEPEEIKTIALARVSELAETEISFIEAYAEQSE
ncbi:MAG TPA: hypothetical protein VN426_11045 [Syntrophomonadaceae bacterium]|nr:hypothetical protein [Syntrophomonadaceae bacterium]